MNESQHSHGGIAPLLERFRELEVLVLGDVMLDEYLSGEVARTSPEAPVPVVKVARESWGLGGAANVAHLTVALGAKARLIGAVGVDRAGDRLLARCAELTIDVEDMLKIEGRITTRKVRVLAPRQQVLRIDWEADGPIEDAHGEKLLASLRRASSPDALVISDYAKGLLSRSTVEEVIRIGREWGVPVLVDPKHADLTRYRGATLIKANQREFEAAVGESLGSDLEASLLRLAPSIVQGTQIESMIVTLGEHGLAIFPKSGEAVFLRSAEQEVFDVSGAGDTVIAVLALSLAAGVDIRQAARTANEAAGVAVGKRGVAVVSPAELAARFRHDGADKVLARAALLQRVAWWRAQGRRIVLTNGCFDLLHVGHLHLLREASRLGDVLIVAVNSDDSVRRLKGPDRPLISETERTALLAALDCVDAVVVFDEDTPRELLEEVRPDVLAKGADYTVDQVVGRRMVEASGGIVTLIPLIPDRSTSSLLDKIRSEKN